MCDQDVLSLNRNRHSLALRPPPSHQDFPPPPKSAPGIQGACIRRTPSAVPSNARPRLSHSASSGINFTQVSRIREKRMHPGTISRRCQRGQGFDVCPFEEDRIEDQLVVTKSLHRSLSQQSLSLLLLSPTFTMECMECNSTPSTFESSLSNRGLPKPLTILIPENSDSQSDHSESPITFADSNGTSARIDFFPRPEDRDKSFPTHEKDTWVDIDKRRRSLDLRLNSAPSGSRPSSEGTVRSLKRSQSMRSCAQIRGQNHHQIDQNRAASESYSVHNRRAQKMIQISEGLVPSTHSRCYSDYSIDSAHTKISTLGSGNRLACPPSCSPVLMAKVAAQDEIEIESDTKLADIIPEHSAANIPPTIRVSPLPSPDSPPAPQIKRRRARFTLLFKSDHQDSNPQQSKPDPSTKQVKVKMTGRRLWGFMDRRPRLKEVDVVDVIDRLRNLKAA